MGWGDLSMSLITKIHQFAFASQLNMAALGESMDYHGV